MNEMSVLLLSVCEFRIVGYIILDIVLYAHEENLLVKRKKRKMFVKTCQFGLNRGSKIYINIYCILYYIHISNS